MLYFNSNLVATLNTASGFPSSQKNMVCSRIESYLYALVVLACLGTIPVIFYQGQGVNSPLLTAADWTIWAIFVIEYGVLLILTPDRKRYARGNWLSAGIIVLSFPQLPAVMGFIRLVRLTRILRLFLVAAKGLRTMKLAVSQKSFVYMLGTTVFLVMVAAQLLHMFEPMPGGFTDGLSWAVVTTTTVGYGDIAPKIGPGRLIAVVLMLTGTTLIATIAVSASARIVVTMTSVALPGRRGKLSRVTSWDV